MRGFDGKYALDKDGWIGGWWGRPRFEFTNDIRDPLTYDDGDLLVRPDNHFFTDKGSVPRIAQMMVPIWFDRARFEKSYMLHDSGYKHGGHWVANKGKDFRFVKMSRKQVDRYLYDMVLAEGGSTVTAWMIYRGVRMGGWASWKRQPPAG